MTEIKMRPWRVHQAMIGRSLALALVSDGYDMTMCIFDIVV